MLNVPIVLFVGLIFASGSIGVLTEEVAWGSFTFGCGLLIIGGVIGSFRYWKGPRIRR